MYELPTLVHVLYDTLVYSYSSQDTTIYGTCLLYTSDAADE